MKIPGIWSAALFGCVCASSALAATASPGQSPGFESDDDHPAWIWDAPVALDLASAGGNRGVGRNADLDVDESGQASVPVQWLDVQPTLDPVVRTTAPSTTRPVNPNSYSPEASSADSRQFPTIGGTYGLNEFFNHFAPYEPMYFVGGQKAPQIKFNLSIRYRFITADGPLATQLPFVKGFNFAYSQTSLWDWSDPNNPFFKDTSYRPEFFYYLENLPHGLVPPGSQAGVQGGIGHESNGVLPPNHRSLNILFMRPILTYGDPKSDLFLTIAPKAYIYIGEINLNRDLPQYRGYCDIRVAGGQRDGLQLAAIGRVGSHFNKGSAQLDLTYPLTKLLGGNVDLSLDAQYFIGYGDSLLGYNQYSQVWRVGLALVR